MKRVFGVVGCGFGTGEFDDIDAAEIAELVAFGFQPDIFDPGNFCGHVFYAGESFLLVVERSGVAELVSDYVDNSFWLAEFIDGGCVAGGDARGK